MKLSGRTPHIPLSAAIEFHLLYLLPVPEMGVQKKSAMNQLLTERAHPRRWPARQLVQERRSPAAEPNKPRSIKL